METTSTPKTKSHLHVTAIPHPGRGHVNPLLNFCKLLTSRGVHVSFIVTEEWLGLISSEPRSEKWDPISFVTVPNVIPSEKVKAADLNGFFRAVHENLPEPVERLLQKLVPPPDLIIADTILRWGVEVGRKTKIPVASFWTSSASHFSTFFHHQLIVNSSYYPVDLSGNAGEERIDFIPGIPSIRLEDLPSDFHLNNANFLDIFSTSISIATKAQCIIFRTIDQLEEAVINALRTSISPPIYIVGPTIPYTKTLTNPITTPNYIKWLDTQRESSVLYVSQGSVFSASKGQMNELIAGLKDSGIPFLWVGRNQVSELRSVLGDGGIVVEWCEQWRVLSHPSIGGYLTHCGWNSTLEAAFAGVPTLTFPLHFDQFLNSKLIVEDWGIGWRVKQKFQDLATKEQIVTLLKKFMDLADTDRKELDNISKKLKELLYLAVGEDGSAKGFDEFLLDSLSFVN